MKKKTKKQTRRQRITEFKTKLKEVRRLTKALLEEMEDEEYGSFEASVSLENMRAFFWKVEDAVDTSRYLTVRG